MMIDINGIPSHQVNLLPHEFEEVWSGNATFIHRLNFPGKTGDIVHLFEYDPRGGDTYSGRWMKFTCGYIAKNKPYLQDGWSIISVLQPLHRQTTKATLGNRLQELNELNFSD